MAPADRNEKETAAGMVAPALAIIALGLALTALVFGFQRELEEERRRTELRSHAADLAELLNDRFRLVEERMAAARAFFSAVPQADASDFAAFVRPLLESRVAVEGFLWVPRVTPDARPRFEAAIRRPIRGSGDSPLPPGNDAFPVRFAEPYMAAAPPVGRDLASVPSLRQAMERSRVDDHIVVGRLEPSGGEPGRESVVIAVTPVYGGGQQLDTPEQRERALIGYVAGVLRLAPMFQLAMAAQAAEPFDLALMEETDDGRTRVVSWRGAVHQPQRVLAEWVSADATLQLPLAFGGRSWRLVVHEASAGPARPSRAAWLTLALGVTATGGTAAIIYLLLQTRRRIRRKVTQRTAELVRSQADLRESRERLQLALTGARMWAWDWDILADRLHWVSSPDGLLGPEPGGGYGDFRQLVLEEDRPLFLAAGAATLREQADYSCEFRIRRTDGRIAWVFARGVGLRDATGRLVRLIGVSQDTSARHEVEAELLRARDAAEQASRVKSEFLATMSHEIRTPMNGILGMAELLKLSGLTGDQLDYVRVLQDSGNNLMAILNDILDFSKIEAGRLELDIGPVMPAALASEVVQLMLPRAREKGLMLDLELEDGVPEFVQADAMRLRQILLNLVGNAIKFTDSGNITVSLQGGEQLRFAVRDTGIGIPASAMPQLFQPFSQADSSITRRFGGTGLGLAICKRLADAMQGRLGVDSVPGEGSCFWLELPVSGDSEPLVPALPAAALVLPRWPGRRVLVVEDNAVNARVVLRLLEACGIEARQAENGQVALDVLFGGDPGQWDLILMDIRMPVMDGLVATRQIRAGEERRCPIVALTANAFDEDRTAALAAGMDDFLAKPLVFAELEKVLRRFLGDPAPVAADRP